MNNFYKLYIKQLAKTYVGQRPYQGIIINSLAKPAIFDLIMTRQRVSIKEYPFNKAVFKLIPCVALKNLINVHPWYCTVDDKEYLDRAADILEFLKNSNYEITFKHEKFNMHRYWDDAYIELMIKDPSISTEFALRYL